MKIFILTILMTSITANAQTAEIKGDNYYGYSDLVEFPEKATSEPKYAESWSLYRSDSCTMYNKANSNEDYLRDKGLRRCRDNSVSFVQPKSTGAQGWEGKCGQTFGANSIYSICSLAVDPNTYFKKLFRDVTPGVRPGTVRKGMGKAFKKNQADCPSTKTNRWSFIKLRNTKNFIARLKQFIIPNYSHPNLININRRGKDYLRNPVGVLVQNPGGKYLHWVTVVDVLSSKNSCQFVVNHWDNQYLLPCEKLASWSGKVGKTYPVILSSYSTVVYK